MEGMTGTIQRAPKDLFGLALLGIISKLYNLV
jgi:hypothetical protein